MSYFFDSMARSTCPGDNKDVVISMGYDEAGVPMRFEKSASDSRIR